MVRRTLQRLRQSATSAATLLALSVLMPAGVLALTGWWDYAGTVAAADQDLHNTIDILSDDVAHDFDEDAALLATLRDQFDRPDAQTALPPEAASRIDEFLKAYPQLVRAALLDRHGAVLYGSGAAASGDADGKLLRSLAASDRPLAIGAPSETGSDSFAVALRRRSPDGAFNGIVLLSLSTERVKSLFARLAARREATVLLCRTDGMILARLPPGPATLPPTAPLLVNLQSAHAGSFTSSGPDEALFAYRQLADYPLVVAYGIGRGTILADWWSRFRAIAAIGLLAVIGLCLANLAVIRGRAALRLREERLDAEMARRREAEAETRRSLEEALRANTAKSGFLAMISHELRTPLNAIIGFSEMMTGELYGPLGSDRYKGYVTDILLSGTHLLSVINDILDLSRLDLGRLRPDVDMTDIFGVLEQTVRMVTPMATKAGVVLALVAAPGLPSAPADARLLKQALLNVLSNAIKFTPHGGSIHVLAKYLPDRSVVIEIRDSGIGMTQAQIELALEPFAQVDDSLHRKYEGAGLGLPLARAFVELQGGRFEIESKPGRGTVIRFALPAQAAAAGRGTAGTLG